MPTHGRRAAHRKIRLRKRWLIAVLAATAALVAGVAPSLAAPSPTSLFGSAVPAHVTEPDYRSVELGVRFSSSVAGTVTGIRFYQGPKNRGTHVGHLWSSTGRQLAAVTFSRSTRTGWQQASLSKPVAIAAGETYIASYLAPQGGYSEDDGYFARAKTVGPLTVPAHGGVYKYPRGFPTSVWKDANYYVDVVFQPATSTPTPSSSGSRTPTSKPSSTSTPKPSSTPTRTPTPTPTPTPTSTPSSPPTTTLTNPPSKDSAALDLPRVPWEGGPAYYAQFAKPKAAGWANPDFFPIALWWGGISSNSDVAWDKSVGVNTYVLMDPSTPYKLFADNDVYWVGSALNSSFTSSSTNWVGDFLWDEIDGWAPSYDSAKSQLNDAIAEYGDDGRFKYANFTHQIIGGYMSDQQADSYTNDFTDVVSLDTYYYTDGSCDSIWPQIAHFNIAPVDQAHCKTASSYGNTIQALRAHDASDGKLQPLWSFVENLNGAPGGAAKTTYIQPDQLEGAVMDSIINEARGIIYFNQSMSGSCQSGNVVRSAQTGGSTSCAYPQVMAMKHVDGLIQSLAPVLNTQSYQWKFGTGLDTMLKVSGGYAYIFSMTDGTGTPGARTFTLPAGVNGTSAEVVGENRTVPVSGGKFTDSFAQEYTYHVYKIALRG